ncbi:MAG: acylneuraminate cytidylyltransferase family protein [Bacteroidota bacterium]
MTISDTLCFIPAKAASTRLKKKNILKLDGKELIWYPINNALKSGLFKPENIILSTESPEIREIAKKHGANVPYLREEKLARDPYGVKDVVLDFLERFPVYKRFSTLCVLLPTAPLMMPEDIQGAFEVFKNNPFNAVTSVTVSDHSALRAVYIREDNVEPIFPEFILKKSQELEPTYRLNGAVLFLNMEAFLENKSFFIKPLGAYTIPYERSIDIDDETGYLLAKFLKQNL